MRHFNLETFAGGELSRQINRDIEAVMRNVVDPNTDVKAKDLKGYGQIYIRAEVYLGWGILVPEWFARIKEA